MLSPDIFQKASETFGVSVGVAKAIEYSSSNEPDIEPEITDQALTNVIICRAIEAGLYPELQRGLWRQRGRRCKTLTKYKTVWKEIRSK
jgi:hypothetical protein